MLNQCLGRDIQVAGLIGSGYDKNSMVLAKRHGFCISAQLNCRPFSGWHVEIHNSHVLLLAI
ncbi:hypothetical protein C4J91_4708 [Pseudomonas sp. R3-52-08]|nr:hypothetical protein C4J91_4708 [Pseudomonas sp. R3-52-08]